MRRFTVFTFLYLAVGLCLTATAFQSPDLASRPKTVLLLNAGLLYLFAILSTFSFWHEGLLRNRNRRHEQPIWRQRFITIAPWLLIVLSLVSLSITVLTEYGKNSAIEQAALALTLILVNVELIFTRRQIQS